jgi:predicted RND superfamily exporter protein
MHNFKRYYHQTPNIKESITHALTGTGRAMLITSLVLSFGFYIYVFSSMNNLFAFGFLTGTAILAALVADFLIAPALLTLYFKNYKG